MAGGIKQFLQLNKQTNKQATEPMLCPLLTTSEKNQPQNKTTHLPDIRRAEKTRFFLPSFCSFFPISFSPISSLIANPPICLVFNSCCNIHLLSYNKVFNFVLFTLVFQAPSTVVIHSRCFINIYGIMDKRTNFCRPDFPHL